MSTHHPPAKLMLPRMRHGPDRERLKIIVAIVLFALIAIGIVIALKVWWGAVD